jgi:hypothetical protein
MKTAFFILLFFMTLFLMFISCEQNKPESPTQSTLFFQGNHNLMSLNNVIKQTEHSSIKGNFFICVGSINGSSEKTTEQVARFSWKNNNNEFVVSEISMKQVRFQIDSTIKIPYCKFKYYDGYCFEESKWWENIIYVVFVLRQEQIYGNDIVLNLKS